MYEKIIINGPIGNRSWSGDIDRSPDEYVSLLNDCRPQMLAMRA
jgi:hypothetical protein